MHNLYRRVARLSQLRGEKITSTAIYLSQNEIKNMYAGTINSIDFLNIIECT